MWYEVTYFGTENVIGHLTDGRDLVQIRPIHQPFSGDEDQIRRSVVEDAPRVLVFQPFPDRVLARASRRWH